MKLDAQRPLKGGVQHNLKFDDTQHENFLNFLSA